MYRVSVTLLLTALLFASQAQGQSSTTGASPSDMLAGVHVQTQTQAYEVTGKTASDLWASISTNGPAQGEKGFAAYTNVQLRWRYAYAPDARGCAVTRAQVHGTIEIQLPRWKAPIGTDPDLVQRWSAFIRALRQHEEVHQSMGLQSAHEIHRALMAVRTPTCQTMIVLAAAAANRVYQAYAERAREYDQKTQHGRTQGAYWTW